ncbi:MAG: hypothetical protein A3J75_08865 [Acidobacteria bacterium RBG_16_68_9]|nr:MAG: hypothetical protein A3J75_08865 [Acidobacteria bacterium RBG_16_68_9]
MNVVVDVNVDASIDRSPLDPFVPSGGQSLRRLCLTILVLLSAHPAFASQAERRSPVVAAVERVRPAVVNISTTQLVEREVASFPQFRDPMFDEFFRDFFALRRQRFTRATRSAC